jgi:hypothetical protein
MNKKDIIEYLIFLLMVAGSLAVMLYLAIWLFEGE